MATKCICTLLDIGHTYEFQSVIASDNKTSNQSSNAGFPKVGFANPWWFMRELQGVRELVQGVSVYH